MFITHYTKYRYAAAHFVPLFLLAVPLTASAQFTNLVNIPGLDADSMSINDYVRALFYIAIGIAAMLAVVKLVIAGAKYMLSDVANTKQTAIADIRGAIFGLLLILATVIILNTISQNIVETDVGGGLPQLDTVSQALQLPAEQRAAADAMCTNYGDDSVGVNCIVRSCGVIYENFGSQNCEEWCNSQDNSVYVPGPRLGGLAGGYCYTESPTLAESPEFAEDRQRCEDLGGEFEVRGVEGVCSREASTEELNTLEQNLAFLENEVRADIVDRLLNENLIGVDYIMLDEDIIDDITNDVGAGITILAIEPPSSFAERNTMIAQFEGICANIAEASGSNTMGVVESGNYLACVDE